MGSFCLGVALVALVVVVDLPGSHLRHLLVQQQPPVL
jgi:hypothetical protein